MLYSDDEMEPGPDTDTVRVCNPGSKTARTYAVGTENEEPSMDTAHSGPSAFRHSPPQPANFHPGAGIAVKGTWSYRVNLPSQT